MKEMNHISCNGNTVDINGNIIRFEHDVLETMEIDEHIIVLTEPKKGCLDNVYGISVVTGQTTWNIQDATEIYPQFLRSPYVAIRFTNEQKLLVTDFSGCRFIVNPLNGKILERTSSVK